MRKKSFLKELRWGRIKGMINGILTYIQRAASCKINNPIGFFNISALSLSQSLLFFVLFFFFFFFPQSLKITSTLLMYLEDDYPLRLGFSS